MGGGIFSLKAYNMKKLAALTSVFSLAASASFAQSLSPEDIMVATQSAPGTEWMIPALLTLLVMAAVTASSANVGNPT
jgi:hypothetical protein